MSRETSHPARQPSRQGLSLAQFAGDRAELLPALSPAASLRESLAQWWLTNQLWFSWSLLLVPLILELIYGAFLLPYLVPISILATYLIYRGARARRDRSDKSREWRLEQIGRAHV